MAIIRFLANCKRKKNQQTYIPQVPELLDIRLNFLSKYSRKEASAYSVRFVRFDKSIVHHGGIVKPAGTKDFDT